MSKHALAQSWILANPWLWACTGCALKLLACLGGAALGDTAMDARFFVCAIGLIACGGGVTIRLRSESPAFAGRLGESRSKIVLLILIGIYVLSALGITTLVVIAAIAAVREMNPTLKVGGPVLLWFLIVPMTVQAIQNVWQKLAMKEPPSQSEETSLLLAVLGLAGFLSSWALYVPDNPLEWDSIRMTFAVIAFVAIAAAPLAVLSQSWRRAVVSVIFVLHFGGIATAVLAAEPSPWLVQQIWTRIYRPYLEFMYLNNAYHFYAPEPGPASYLWFRLYYEDPNNGDIYPLWLKIPDYDDKTGKYRNTLALNYQRFLSMTENTAAPAAPFSMMEEDGVTPADFVRRRAMNTPPGAKEWEKIRKDPILGTDLTLKPGDLLIPLLRTAPMQHQYYPSRAHVQMFLESFARHVAGRPYPQHPEYKLKSLKIYRVRHEIPLAPVGPRVNVLNPRDPELYRPFYMGEYDPDGKMKVKQDPFLYWLLPIQKESPDGLVRDWARRHAGDSRWVWNEKRREWTEGPDPQ